jgi:hypothetical protein
MQRIALKDVCIKKKGIRTMQHSSAPTTRRGLDGAVGPHRRVPTGDSRHCQGFQQRGTMPMDTTITIATADAASTSPEQQREVEVGVHDRHTQVARRRHSRQHGRQRRRLGAQTATPTSATTRRTCTHTGAAQSSPQRTEGEAEQQASSPHDVEISI